MAISAADAAAVALEGGLQSKQFQGLFTVIPFTFTFDENSLAAGLSSAGDITVVGAALGDFVLVAATTDLVDIALSAFVASSDTITVTATDLSAATNTGRAGNETYNGLLLRPNQNVIKWAP
jgi:hypothetical protein